VLEIKIQEQKDAINSLSVDSEKKLPPNVEKAIN